jgi:hypothetical protein
MRASEPSRIGWRVRLILLLVAVGLGLRSYHYLRDRAVWQDEAGLLLTVTSRGFGDLFLGRLDYHQAAPPLYACLLRAVSMVLGDDSLALRLPSFLASCAALLLFVRVARRQLPPPAVPWAVLLFAVSEQLLWHASEAKAYSIDVLAAVVVLAVPCYIGRRRPHLPGRLPPPSTGGDDPLSRQLLAYTFLVPILLLFSYPASFLCTGLLVAYLPAVHARNRWRTWMTYATLAATVGGVLLWLVVGPIRCQHDAEIHSCWIACMPCWETPWTIPGWLLLSPFEVGRYCCKPLGQVLTVLAVPGTLALWRRGERTSVRLMTLPLLLAFLAACLHRYPFGGARIMAYATPAVLLLGAAGVPPSLAWLAARGRLPVAALVALLLVPGASSLWQVVSTWREADIAAVAAYVEAERRPGDFILGNDVAQQYYFRRLGPTFHLLDDAPIPSPAGSRLWVVMTAALPCAERVRMAGHLAPVGWHTQQQCESPYTTVILFCR